MLVEFDKAGELSTVARIAELGDVLGVGIERDENDDIGRIMSAVDPG